MVDYRLAVPDDAEAGAALHRACWIEAYGGLVSRDRLELALADWGGPEKWRRYLEHGPPRHLAVADGELVGFSCAGPAREDPSPAPTRLHAVYVRAAWWGHGVGQRLLDLAIGDAPAVREVFTDNARARAFYERNGFRPWGEPKTFERLGLEEIYMVRPARSG